MSDPTNHVHLGGFLAEVIVLGDGTWGEGSVYREKSGPGVLKSWTEWTVVVFDPPNILSHRSEDGSLTATGTWTFEATSPDSTLVRQVADFSVDVRFRPAQQAAEKLFSWMMRREADRALNDLRRIFADFPSKPPDSRT